MPRVSAVIVCGGSSTRMGGINKQLIELDKIPVMVRSALAFDNHPLISEIVVVARQGDEESYKSILEKFGVNKLKAVVAGGDTRQKSVLNGVNAVSGQSQLVAIHDGARPLITERVITDCVLAAEKHNAAAPVIEVKDTVKTVDENGFITSTPDRSVMRFVQTPQVFSKELYLTACKKADNSGIEFTDDCMLVELSGNRVFTVKGDYENIKITTRQDIALAEMYLKGRENDA